ncbi:MAG: hypothetical protein K0Q95_1770 [Bacteroidota bacterium]|jgi:hypothetical protein|nr:hypothetical protein [Bacteroidota bacterium]
MRLKYYLTFISIVISLGLEAQSYLPFIQNNASWRYQYYDDFHNPTGCITTYYMNGDTAISGIQYKKIHVSELAGCNTFYGHYLGPPTLYVRESGQKVYLRFDTSTVENLVFDFNVNTGDTLYTVYPDHEECSTDTLVVVTADSVLMNDGYHKRYNAGDGYFPIIEGIGNMYGNLFESIYCNMVSGIFNLQCYSDSTGTNIYPGFWSQPCVVPVGVHDTQNKQFPEISPNPFQNELSFFMDGSFELRITDLLGREILKINSKDSEYLNTSSWQKGFYSVSIKSDFREFSYKVVKT